MKKLLVILPAIIGLTLIGFTGCAKKDGVDTSKAESAFQTAGEAEKGELEKAISALKAGDYPGAAANLQKLAASAKLTPEQKTVLEDLIKQVQTKLSDAGSKAADDASKAAKKAGEGASKAVDDMTKSLKK